MKPTKTEIVSPAPLFVIGVILLMVCVIYVSFYVKKTVSYNLIYKSKVEETIREMVKPEYLINNQ
jgi:hypothetical protein